VQGLASRIAAAGIFLSLWGLLAACSGVPIDHGVEPEIFGSLPAEKPLELGKRYYSKGEFGLAEQAFRSAIELNKGDPEAWLGLAASYDRLRRFDQARRAYDVLLKLTGRTPVVLNNLGYHYILQGEHAKANEILREAKRSDPGNKFIRNNIDLVQTRDHSDHYQSDQ
jgi:Flp pilus assembly protein TadD